VRTILFIDEFRRRRDVEQARSQNKDASNTFTDATDLLVDITGVTDSIANQQLRLIEVGHPPSSASLRSAASDERVPVQNIRFAGATLGATSWSPDHLTRNSPPRSRRSRQ
jgi:hypothetical protein